MRKIPQPSETFSECVLAPTNCVTVIFNYNLKIRRVNKCDRLLLSVHFNIKV